MAKLTIKISADGKQINSDVEGIKGPKCVQVDSFLKSLGAFKYEHKSSYYDSATPNEVQITEQQ